MISSSTNKRYLSVPCVCMCVYALPTEKKTDAWYQNPAKDMLACNDKDCVSKGVKREKEGSVE
jgi:hypothetical protein